jgi:hypothetical protein
MTVTLASSRPKNDASMSVASIPHSGSSLESPWVRGPVWDGFWMLSALWLVPISLWLSHDYFDPEDSPLDLFYLGLTALFWIGHRLSSAYLAYCTEAYRPLLRAQPIRFVVLPVAIAAGSFAVFLPADAALPWSREERLVMLAILDYIFVTHHFASQHFGAFSLYRTRAGRNACYQTRRSDKLFALGVGGGLVFLSDILAGTVAYQDRWIDRWSLAAWLVSEQDTIRAGATAVTLAATAGMLFIELRSPRKSLPRILYVLGLAAMVTLALRPRAFFPFLVIWTSQHWILATGLASQTPVDEQAPGRHVVRRTLHTVNTRPWAIVGIFLAASVVLLPVFEVEANRQDGTYYSDRIFGAVAGELRSSSWVPALLALGFATGFIHYLLDGSVYRLSNPQIRTAARGLLARSGKAR